MWQIVILAAMNTVFSINLVATDMRVPVSHGRNDYVCALLASREVSCIGKDSALDHPRSFIKLTMVSMGTSHACGLQTKGYVECWGSNLYGQINPPTTSNGFPYEFLQVACGAHFTCGIPDGFEMFPVSPLSSFCFQNGGSHLLGLL